MFYILLLLGVLSQIGCTKDESNSFLVWARQYAQDVSDEPSWVCGPLPASQTSAFPWWVSPLQGDDWRKLQCYIHEAQAESMALRRATRSDVSLWPICMTLNQEGHGKMFSMDKTDAIIKRFSEPFLSKDTKLPVIREKIHRYEDGYFQIWDEQLWLTASLGRLSEVALLCWEQQNYLNSSWPTASKFMGWIPLQWCQHTIILQAGDWFATDWSSRHGVRWAAPNGTQWLCGNNLWPWLPPGWVGRCTLGFPWMRGRLIKALPQPARLCVSPHIGMCRALQYHKGLASNSTHFGGLRDVVVHIDSLAQYLDKALNHTANEFSLLSFQVQLYRKAALQHQMALDAVKAAKGRKCAVVNNECCVYLPPRKPVRSCLNTLQDILWAWFSGWTLLIAVLFVVLKLVLFGSFLVDLVLSFISPHFRAMYTRIVLFPAHPVIYNEPPAISIVAEIEEEWGP